MKLKNFFANMARGAAIGISMIIPGVSGGTIAVVMNVYEKIIDAISNIRKDFKNSFLYLLPIFLGIIIAVIAAYFPLKLALTHFPFATMLLFTGLMIGSCPKLIKNSIKEGFSKINILSLFLPLIIVVAICFIPGQGNVDLSISMPDYGYILLFLVGIIASCALVVPGISGSMLLLIFGYYKSLLNTLTALSTDFWHSALVLFLFGTGLIVGFFTIAKLMKYLQTKFPRGTKWAIIGFVLGSIFAIFIMYDHNFPNNMYSTLGTTQIIVGVVLCILGIILSYFILEMSERRKEKSLKQKKEIKIKE